tara:strand:+ start:443 stop:1177 length:735 start_codon:yes stop_codon:yes gene_type:complete
MCAPSCTKSRQTCPPAPAKDKATGFTLQGISQCSVSPSEWAGGTVPDGTVAKCIILSPEMTENEPFQACKDLSGYDLQKCNLCSQLLHFAIPSQTSQIGDSLLSLTGEAGIEKRIAHVAEIVLNDEWQKNCMYDTKKTAKWINDFQKGPEQGGTNPVMRKGTVYDLSNTDLRSTLKCVRTRENPTTPGCTSINCASFDNDPRSSNYCLKNENGNDCCRLALMQPGRANGADRRFPTGWSNIGVK